MTDHLEMQQYLKANLSKKRFTHVMNVAAESRILAETFGCTGYRIFCRNGT